MVESTLSLCALPGVSGWEDEVRDALRTECEAYADEIQTDTMGNLFVRKRGTVSLDKPVMLCAPMDEVGLIVSGYRGDGSLRFECVGRIDRRVLIGKRVELGPERRPGVIGLKAIHLTSKEERDSVPAEDALYIDIGAENEEEARSAVRLGTRASFLSVPGLFGDGLLKAKAIGSRAACAALLKILRAAPATDICCVFSVQNEVECRGALIAANRVEPRAAIALDAIFAEDVSGGCEDGCRLGAGLVIPYMDKRVIYPERLRSAVLSSAEKHGITLQQPHGIGSAGAAASIQRVGAGVPVVSALLPVRNLHTPACIASERDVEMLPKLISGILEDIADGSICF